ncbi:MAG TPA: hypothetical protein HA349_06480, partial [Methanotrichaceae archaeon]|nr:hypothetical protein [Methanotrichaceae archaeon]
MVEKKTAMASALKAFIIIIWLIMATNANILTYEARADLAPIEASSGTEVGGIISSDTKWTLENSPYFLEDDVKVEDASLTIQPGVKVNLDFWSIIIGKDATLIARGTSSNRIEIFSEEELFGSAIYCMDGSIPWDESSKSGSIIEFVEFHLKLPDISFAIYSVSGIKISNNVFYEEGGEGIFVRSVNGIVCDNTIIGGRYGIRGRGNI